MTNHDEFKSAISPGLQDLYASSSRRGIQDEACLRVSAFELRSGRGCGVSFNSWRIGIVQEPDLPSWLDFKVLTASSCTKLLAMIPTETTTQSEAGQQPEYGKRIFPVYLDELARHEPARVMFSIPRSPRFSDGVSDVNVAAFV